MRKRLRSTEIIVAEGSEGQTNKVIKYITYDDANQISRIYCASIQLAVCECKSFSFAEYMADLIYAYNIN